MHRNWPIENLLISLIGGVFPIFSGANAVLGESKV